ncbi:hypothetical protein [Streptomyces sp. cmx-4-9]|uniref:hypothetical protein n=1 Tax=Streptomyces sp. cmx-4-9 TaxID=2790941 RepID=UPI003981145E
MTLNIVHGGLQGLGEDMDGAPGPGVLAGRSGRAAEEPANFTSAGRLRWVNICCPRRLREHTALRTWHIVQFLSVALYTAEALPSGFLLWTAHILKAAAFKPEPATRRSGQAHGRVGQDAGCPRKSFSSRSRMFRAPVTVEGADAE